MQLKLSIVKLFLLVIISVFIIIPTTNANQAEDILDATDIKGGLVVYVGCGNGNLTADFKINDSYIVHGLDADKKNVEDARKYINSLGIYGKVSVARKGKELPYIDNLINLVVSENLGEVPMEEVMRVLCPKGVAYIKDGDEWVKKVKPRPKDMDEWTHYLHDTDGNPVAQDSIVGPPRHFQWVGSPRWSRHHDHMEYHLFAVSREIPEPKVQESRNSGSCVRVAKSASLNPANKPVIPKTNLLRMIK